MYKGARKQIGQVYVQVNLYVGRFIVINFVPTFYLIFRKTCKSNYFDRRLNTGNKIENLVRTTFGPSATKPYS